MIDKPVTTSTFVATIAIASFVLTAAGPAFAETNSPQDFSYSDMLKVAVKFEQAMKIASENAEGQIVEVSLDEFDGQIVYMASLADATSLSELIISGQDGAVLSSSVQTASTPELMEKLVEFEIAEVLELVDMVSGLGGAVCEISVATE
jgi:hypothetical protein